MPSEDTTSINESKEYTIIHLRSLSLNRFNDLIIANPIVIPKGQKICRAILSFSVS